MIKSAQHFSGGHQALMANVINQQLMNEFQWQQVGSMFKFTNREKQICEHLFSGQTRQEIADRLEIKPRTVRHYMENIHKKMNVNNRVGVVLRVIAARDYIKRNAEIRQSSTH